MTFTLPDLRADIRADLRDASSADWSDAQLDRAAALALNDLSLADPNQVTSAITVTGRTVTLSAAPPAGIGAADAGALIAITAIEYPVDQWPPAYVRWSQFAGVITLHTDAELAAADVKLHYTRTHQLDATSGTVPDPARQPLAIGAAAHALRQLIAERHDTLNVSGNTVDQLASEMADRLAIWIVYLDRFRRRVRQRSIYRPDDPHTARDIVGPIA